MSTQNLIVPSAVLSEIKILTCKTASHVERFIMVDQVAIDPGRWLIDLSAQWGNTALRNRKGELMKLYEAVHNDIPESNLRSGGNARGAPVFHLVPLSS